MPDKPRTAQTAPWGNKRLLRGIVVGVVFSCLGTSAAAIEAGGAHDLYVSVQNHGSPVEGLGPGNFRLYEDGQPRPFRLEPLAKPADVVFVVENSVGSSVYRNQIEAAMQQFMNSAPEGNWYALVTFARDVHVAVDFTRNKEKIASAYESVAQSDRDEISTFDAAYRVLNDLMRTHSRRVVVFIGSGLDRYSERSLGDVQKAIEATEATIYTIGTQALLRQAYDDPYTFPGMQLDTMQSRGVLETLAGDSGGKAWFPNSDSGFADAMSGVFDDMASQYRLADEAEIPADGKVHKIKLEAFGFDADGGQMPLEVRVRKGWRAG